MSRNDASFDEAFDGCCAATCARGGQRPVGVPMPASNTANRRFQTDSRDCSLYEGEIARGYARDSRQYAAKYAQGAGTALNMWRADGLRQ